MDTRQYIYKIIREEQPFSISDLNDQDINSWELISHTMDYGRKGEFMNPYVYIFRRHFDHSKNDN